MRIAVVGSGISGLTAAWLLSRRHDVVLYEANDYLGGHTDTHEVFVEGQSLRIDTGFIVHNPQHYPLLTRLFKTLGVQTQATTMSFSVQDARSGLEYNATRLDTLFCQRRNLWSPRFWRMLRDLSRFYREAPRLLQLDEAGPPLGEYLKAHHYSDAFRDLHLIPMASALWSSPPAEILAFPAKYLVQFMANHQMLNLGTRPSWSVVQGGSRTYVDAMTANWRVRTRLATPVVGVSRDARGVYLRTATGVEEFDHLVLACHSDQALELLDEPTSAEREVLGAIAYQSNEMLLHTDEKIMPAHKKAWAAWNVFLPAVPSAACTVSYCMNLLQGLDVTTPLIVSLNRGAEVDPACVLLRRTYHHPVYTQQTLEAQRRKKELQGVRRTWFAGAYWGWGFHEDGIRSGVEVAAALGVDWNGTVARMEEVHSPASAHPVADCA